MVFSHWLPASLSGKRCSARVDHRVVVAPSERSFSPNSLLLGVLNSFLGCVCPFCHWCPPFSGHAAFLFICLRWCNFVFTVTGQSREPPVPYFVLTGSQRHCFGTYESWKRRTGKKAGEAEHKETVITCHLSFPNLLKSSGVLRRGKRSLFLGCSQFRPPILSRGNKKAPPSCCVREKLREDIQQLGGRVSEDEGLHVGVMHCI